MTKISLLCPGEEREPATIAISATISAGKENELIAKKEWFKKRNGTSRGGTKSAKHRKRPERNTKEKDDEQSDLEKKSYPGCQR